MTATEVSEEAKSEPRLGWWAAAIVALAAAVIPAALFPGDAAWAYDEPQLVAISHRANQAHLQVTHGLAGNFPLPYGPLPAQLHQLLLLVSHDPRWLVLIRGTACALMAARSLLWLARTIKLNAWFVPAVLAAPYLWLFGHTLWDATLALPLGCLALAAYAAFLRGGGRWPLLIAVAACLGTLLVHLQALPLAAAILGHLLWRRRDAIRRHATPLAALTALILGMNLPYVLIAVGAVGRIAFTGSGARHGGNVSFVEGFTGPLRGGMILSGRDLMQRYRLPPVPRAWQRVAACTTEAGYGMVGLGIAVSAWRCVRRLGAPVELGDEPTAASGSERGHGVPESDTPARSRSRLSTGPVTIRNTVSMIALAGLAMQILLHGVARIPAAPQYFFGTFALHVLFAGIGVRFLCDAAPRLRLSCRAIGLGLRWGASAPQTPIGRPAARGDTGKMPVPRVKGVCPGLHWMIAGVYGVAAGALTVAGIVNVHRDGWTAGTLSPTLADQIAVVRQLNARGDVEAMTDVSVYQFKDGPDRPHALWTLRLLFPAPASTRPATQGRLVIRYKAAPHLPGGKSGRIELIEAAADADIPAGATAVQLYPPADYKIARPKPVPAILGPMD